MLLEGKTAVITGCNRGIGKAVLDRMAAQGASAFALVRREDAAFTPDYPQDRREADLARWHKAVERSRGWAG